MNVPLSGVPSQRSYSPSNGCSSQLPETRFILAVPLFGRQAISRVSIRDAGDSPWSQSTFRCHEWRRLVHLNQLGMSPTSTTRPFLSGVVGPPKSHAHWGVSVTGTISLLTMKVAPVKHVARSICPQLKPCKFIVFLAFPQRFTQPKNGLLIKFNSMFDMTEHRVENPSHLPGRPVCREAVTDMMNSWSPSHSMFSR